MGRKNNYTARLCNPGVWLLKHAWLDHANDQRLHANAEAWRRNKDKLRQSWEAFMEAILSPAAWTALCLLLECQHDLRWLWIKPGGYFFTKAGNRRKVIRQKLIPRIITVTLRDRLVNAERIYCEALKSEIFTRDAIEIATLVLAGSITGSDEFLASTPSIKRSQLRKRKRKFRLWAPSRTSSLRYLCSVGFLKQPRDRDPRM